jgi:hypothetical protein
VRNFVLFLCVAFLSATATPTLLDATPGRRAFIGSISDSACGLHHLMSGTPARQCTLRCVQMGAKFVLVDEVRQRVYALSDQIKAKAYAGQKVRVIGTLKGSGIEVAAMTLIKQKPH